MKKYGLLVGITLMAFMTACGKASADPGDATKDASAETGIVETDEKENDTTAVQSGGADYESQLDLFAAEYSNWKILYEDWASSPDEDVKVVGEYKVAVADLNRNGRLELICSSLQGTGLFGVTVVYEVNESYDGVIRLDSVDDKDGEDVGGDFISHPVLNCYEKDGIYYYAVEDYTPTGASLIEECLYAYSFEDCIDHEKIGGYTLKVDEYDYDAWCAKSVLVKFCDANRDYLDDEKALDKLIKDYWKDYKEQPCVEIKWVDVPEESDCLASLKESLEGYNEDSALTCELLPDYRTHHGDTPEYTIRHPE